MLVKNKHFKLNESQFEAVLSCFHKIHYEEEPSLGLIWGPPGTGKTKTTSTLLFTLLGRNYRTLTCAPTNVAITEVASRLVKMVFDDQPDALFCSLGNILLFGNNVSQSWFWYSRYISWLSYPKDYRMLRATDWLEALLCFHDKLFWRLCFSIPCFLGKWDD